ncbi:MAG TPA: hypothetical protein DD490_16285 [Acidobacteria bacterium]|nr:hypothetical protein [Acidobacteriota bacterium]
MPPFLSHELVRFATQCFDVNYLSWRGSLLANFSWSSSLTFSSLRGLLIFTTYPIAEDKRKQPNYQEAHSHRKQGRRHWRAWALCIGSSRTGCFLHTDPFNVTPHHKAPGPGRATTEQEELIGGIRTTEAWRPWLALGIKHAQAGQARAFEREKQDRRTRALLRKRQREDHLSGLSELRPEAPAGQLVQELHSDPGKV